MGTLVSLDEYWHTSYEPEMEFVDGALVSRNLGTQLHGLMQRGTGDRLVSPVQLPTTVMQASGQGRQSCLISNQMASGWVDRPQTPMACPTEQHSHNQSTIAGLWPITGKQIDFQFAGMFAELAEE